MTSMYSMGGSPDLTLAVPPSPTAYDMAQDLLMRMQSCAVQLGVRLPERQVVFMSPAPVDCPQVAIVVSGLQPLPLWVDTIVCGEFRWCAQIHVVISRKTCAMPVIGVSSASAPSAANMSEALRVASDDVEVLLKLVETVREIGPQMTVETLAPEGGYQSVVLHILIPLSGGLL